MHPHFLILLIIMKYQYHSRTAAGKFIFLSPGSRFLSSENWVHCFRNSQTPWSGWFREFIWTLGESMPYWLHAGFPLSLQLSGDHHHRIPYWTVIFLDPTCPYEIAREDKIIYVLSKTGSFHEPLAGWKTQPNDLFFFLEWLRTASLAI